MTNEFRNNHYVPVWYQKRFVPNGQIDQELYYLAFNPGVFIDPRGIAHRKTSVKKQGFRKCFVQKDLYTLNQGRSLSTVIEKYFFGEIDTKGKDAVEYFENFTQPSIKSEAFHSMMMYMSTQKLRTPKGLDWISKHIGNTNRMDVLHSMLQLRQIHCAIWTECVWLIADASLTNTKFIISDHPVTVYNRQCGPFSRWCRGSNDPDIAFNATHTIFPLSLDKVLILTNLSWVRNPYQSETKFRPNPNPMRGALFNFMQIQTLRHLTEQEVCEINYVIKSRAFNFIAAAKEEWLYPEREIPSRDWRIFGNGYLFMPDPRPVSLGGEVVIGHGDGRASWFDEYGQRPWQRGYRHGVEDEVEARNFYIFKGEFATLYGPYRRGRTFESFSLDKEKDSEELHQYHLNLYRHKPKKNGFRKSWRLR